MNHQLTAGIILKVSDLPSFAVVQDFILNAKILSWILAVLIQLPQFQEVWFEAVYLTP
ncbi:MAG: hypothetical protein SF097_07500 [Acidobacteriota bacterium]|nr:hypothetical protein [Acidobacteriota bacterium]